MGRIHVLHTMNGIGRKLSIEIHVPFPKSAVVRDMKKNKTKR